MLIGKLSFTLSIGYFVSPNRSWKNHLNMVKNEENKIAIYQTLCILLQEPSVQAFQKLVLDFQQYWFDTEPEFLNYFVNYYLNRQGTLTKHGHDR